MYRPVPRSFCQNKLSVLYNQPRDGHGDTLRSEIAPNNSTDPICVDSRSF